MTVSGYWQLKLVYDAEEREVDLRGPVYLHSTVQYWADTSLAPKNTVAEIMWCCY